MDRKRWMGLIIIILLLLGNVFPALAQDDRNSDIVRVGYFPYTNFNDVDSHGYRSGYGYDYLQELAKYTGWQYQYVTATWEECLRLLEIGEIDLLGSVQMTPERLMRYDFAKLESGLSYAALCVSKDNQTLAYEDFVAFDGMSVGMLAGNSRNDQLAGYCLENNFSVTTTVYNNQEALTKALHSGEVDAMLTSNLRKADNERIIARFAPSPFYFATTKGNTAILEQLNYAQEQIKLGDSFFDVKLNDKYYVLDASEVLIMTRAEQAYLQGLAPLRVAYHENWGPIEYADPKTDAFKGITADLFALIGESTGLEFEYVPTSGLEESVQLLQSGQVALIAGMEMDYTWANQYDVNLTTPYFSSYNLRVSHPDFHGTEEAIIALPKDFLPALQYRLQHEKGNGKVIYYPTAQDCLDAVCNNEADLTYINTYVMGQLRAMASYTHLVPVATADLKNNMSIAMPKSTDPMLLTILNKAVRYLGNTDMDKIIVANTMITPEMTLKDYIYQNSAQAMVICLIFLAMIIGVFALIVYQHNKNEKKIHNLLYVDDLTGIWNFNKFRIEANKMLEAENRPTYALVYTDIDRFKYFNENFGYAEGDLVLRRLADALCSYVEEDECYARAANDNFVILLRYTDDRTFRMRLQIFDKHMNSMPKNEREYHRLVLSSGVYIITPNDSLTLSAMIDCANSARKFIKGIHKSSFAFFDDQFRQAILVEQEIEESMDAALASGQFISYLQPQFDLKTNKIVGMEALVRWQNPQRGMISPAAFIPLFEKNGFIIDLDFAIFEQVCCMISGWLREEKPYVPISSNFSRLHLRRSNFPQRLCEVADRHQVPYELLQIEITESVAQENQEQSVAILDEIRDKGFSIAMDDFGSGYSSLNLLKSLPVDTLKLDKDFLQKNYIGKKDQIIIEGFVIIAEKLNLTVICEGIELEEQSQFLRSIGCNIGQGYLFAKPMPVAEAEQLLWENNYGLSS